MVLCFLSCLAYLYRKRTLKEIHPISAIFPIILGIVSSILAIFHIPFTPLKGFYLGRMIVPLLIPAIWGIYVVFEKFKLTKIIFPLIGTILIIATHKKDSYSHKTWTKIKEFWLINMWTTTRHWLDMEPRKLTCQPSENQLGIHII